jgi:hypothetical protein
MLLFFCFSAARICLAGGCMIVPRAAEKQKRDGGKCAGFYQQVNPPGFSHPDVERGLFGLLEMSSPNSRWLPSFYGYAVSRSTRGVWHK